MAQKKKKTVKKSTKTRSPKRTVKKTAAKPAKAKKPNIKKPKAIGIVTHFFGGIEVAIVKCKTPIRKGASVHFKGATTDFTQTVKSMQYDHEPISLAKKGMQVGIKVRDKVREGDEVYAS